MKRLCEQIVNEEENQVCNEPAVRAVIVRSKVGSMKVWLCRKHLAKRNEAFAALRTGSKK